MVRSRALLSAAFLVASGFGAAADPPASAGAPAAVLAPAAAAPAALGPADAPAARLAPAKPSAETRAPAQTQPVRDDADVEPIKPFPSAEPSPAPAAAIVSAALPQDALAAFAASAEGAPRRIRTQVRLRREAIAAFYAARDDKPLWLRDGAWTDKARQAVARLKQADDDGLDAKSLAIPDLAAGDPQTLAADELALTESIVVYGEEASGGRVDARLVSHLIADQHSRLSVPEILSQIASASNVAGTLDSFNPPQAGFRALRAELIKLRAHPRADEDERVPYGKTLRLGMKDRRVPALRKRLGLPEPATARLVYDRSLMEAVKDFQHAQGLPPSGLLTARTVSALSGPTNRIAEILANMEFWRWEPRNLGTDRIEVNIPEYTLRLYHGDKVVREARVVVGKATTPTPLFSNAIRFVVVNPSWQVPQSIIKKEMLPKLAADPDYLARLGYIVTYKGDVMEVRQPPGDKNALGRIKFLFPNDYAVYLHDTPERALFNARARDFSHGCVRVQNPFALGQDVLGAANGWSEARLKKLIGDKSRTIRLSVPLPIHLEYFTAFVDAKGALEFRPDVYGYTRKVERDLHLEG